MAAYETLSSIRCPTGGFFGVDVHDTTVLYSQYDYKCPGADGRLPRKRAYVKQGSGFPTELSSDVLMMVPEKQTGQVAVFKAPLKDGKDAPSAGWVEIWTQDGLLRTISLGSQSGPALADAWFGGADWSPDASKLVFVAEPKTADRSYWGTNKEDAPRGPLGMSSKFLQKQDWGESYTNKVQAPKVYVLHVESGKVHCAVDPADTSLSCGNACWISDSKVVYVGWQLRERLGIVYCHQRASSLFSVEVPTGDGAEERGTPTQLTTDPIDFSSRSPRVSPRGHSLVFLSREAVGPHMTSSRLRRIDLDSMEIETIVDIEGGKDPDFPGLYVSTLPRRCWWSDDEILLSTQWGFDEALVKVHLAEGKVQRITPHQSKLQSGAVLDVTGHGALVCVSGPTTPPEVYILTPEEGGGAIQWHKQSHPHPNTTAAEKLVSSVTSKVIKVATDDGIGASRFDALVLSPPSTEGSGPPPLVVFAHGGPHSANATRWTAGGLLMALSGYAVVLPNYRGSTGYGELALNSLPAKIGDQDVRDLMLTTEALISSGEADPDRLGVVGGSHGGFLSCHLTSKPGIAHRFKATVMRNPVTNLSTMIGISDIEDWIVYECGLGSMEERIASAGGVGVGAITGGLTDADLQAMWSKSPMSNVKEVTGATLMLLGKEDRRVPPSQGREWVRALRVKGNVQVECYEYDDNDHPIAGPFADADVWVNTVVWLDAYLKCASKQ